jgi:hypothetical protein
MRQAAFEGLRLPFPVRRRQVSGEAIARGLSTAVETGTPASAAPLLDSYCLAVRLAAVTGLDGLVEQFVAGLATAAGLEAPAPPGSAAGDTQLAALKASRRAAARVALRLLLLARPSEVAAFQLRSRALARCCAAGNAAPGVEAPRVAALRDGGVW